MGLTGILLGMNLLTIPPGDATITLEYCEPEKILAPSAIVQMFGVPRKKVQHTFLNIICEQEVVNFQQYLLIRESCESINYEFEPCQEYFGTPL